MSNQSFSSNLSLQSVSSSDINLSYLAKIYKLKKKTRIISLRTHIKMESLFYKEDDDDYLVIREDRNDHFYYDDNLYSFSSNDEFSQDQRKFKLEKKSIFKDKR